VSERTVLQWLAVLPAIAALLLFAGMLQLGRYHPERRILRACEELKGYLAVRSRNAGWYSRTRDWLDKKGAAFHFGTWLQPVSWWAMCMLAAFAGFAAGLQLSLWCGLALGFVLCLVPGILVQYLNYRDNERMLPEIKLIYHGLEIQIRAGVYVTDALTECYAGVQEVRLKQALLDLAGAVTMKADVYDALEHFQSRFDNRYIDALCITLLQAMESGQAVELLADIAEQVKDMEVSVMGRRKGALDRSVTFYQLGILAAVLGMVLYACIEQMFTAALRF
jgi:Flp pilus assembly protein TadB